MSYASKIELVKSVSADVGTAQAAIVAAPSNTAQRWRVLSMSVVGTGTGDYSFRSGTTTAPVAILRLLANTPPANGRPYEFGPDGFVLAAGAALQCSGPAASNSLIGTVVVVAE